MPPKKRKLEDLYEDEEPIGRQPFSKRRKINDYDLMHYLEKQIKISHEQKQYPLKEKSNKKKPHIDMRGIMKKTKIFHSLEKQALVIFLRFGSLNSDKREWMKATEVYEKTGIKISSQWNIIN